MNIFFCYKLNKYSGWGTLSLSYIKAFNKKRSIVFCNEKNNKLKIKQYPILRDPLKYLKNPFFVIIDSIKIVKFLKQIKKKKNVKLNAHFLVEPYVLFLLIINKFFVNKIFYCIGTYSNILANSLKFTIIFKQILSNLTHVIFLSNYSKKIILKKIILKKFVKIIILNPILKINSKIRNDNKILFNILSVGAIKKRKGYHHLIEIMNILVNKYKLRIILNIAGQINDNIYFNSLILNIKKYKLEKYILFTGEINYKKLNQLYTNCNIFALLSEQQGYNLEGYGIVYLEALARGKQVIISEESGATDLRKINKKLFITKPRSYKKISKFIKNIYINKNNLTTYENKLIFKKNYENNLNIFTMFRNSLSTKKYNKLN
jgi:glycosyltransferase involved in cell wall biosynthesis